MSKEEIELQVKKLPSVSMVTESEGFFRAVLNEAKLKSDRNALYEVPNLLRSFGVAAVLDEDTPCWEFGI